MNKFTNFRRPLRCLVVDLASNSVSYNQRCDIKCRHFVLKVHLRSNSSSILPIFPSCGYQTQNHYHLAWLKLYYCHHWTDVCCYTGIETTLLDSVKQSPETYSKAVGCFVESWRAMDERERLHWLQTRIEREITAEEQVTMYDVAQAVQQQQQQQLDETQVATNKLFMDDIVENQGYSDIVVAQHHHHHPQTLQVTHHHHPHTSQHHVVMQGSFQQTKRRKTSGSHKLEAELSLAVSESGLSYYLTQQ